jgi:predicted ATPase
VIEQIAVRNFKAFTNCSAEFAPMTLVLGENGIGKSTLVQAILLSKQVIASADGVPDRLFLNGPFVHIGNGFDALRQNADDEHIYVDLRVDGEPLSWVADYIAGSDVLPMRFTEPRGIEALRNTRVRYLSAERVGPQLIAPYSQSEASRSDVDEKGTNAFGLLHYSSDLALESDDARVPESATSRSVLALFNHYLALVSTGAAVSVQDLSEIDSVSATFSFTGQSELPMERIRSTNVGFGLSYVSSIIITCLIAQRGDLIIIENPEAHLHTKGQRAITELLIRTARAGIQVICESHSREMLYYARQKILDQEIPHDAASVLYVYLENDGSGDRRAAPWFPLTRSIHELGPVGANFLEYFGAPTDFVQNVVPA